MELKSEELPCMDNALPIKPLRSLGLVFKCEVSIFANLVVIPLTQQQIVVSCVFFLLTAHTDLFFFGTHDTIKVGGTF